MTSAYLLPLANHLWQSTLFAAALGLLTLAFRKNRARVRFALWLAASLKFLIPFSLLVAIGSQMHVRTVPSAAPVAPLTFVVRQIGQPFVPAPDPVSAPRPTSRNRVAVLLAGVWTCGFLFNLIPWVRRWRSIRASLRAASPISLDLPIRVMTSPLRLEPGVFGIRRPVLLLPVGLLDHLTSAQLESILAHELCHVRYRDNLAAALHMLVEALFWFYPLVWWIETRLVAERERACDEEVLRAGRDPEGYAEGILKICNLCLESPLACVAGVTGADLKKRIEAIMTNQLTHTLTFGKKVLLLAAGSAAVAIPLALGMLDLPIGRAQSQNEKPIQAEVVSVKRNLSEDPRSMGMSRSEPGGKLSIKGVLLYFIIARAYNVGFQSPRLSGGPDWIRSERYDIEAIAEAGAIPAGLPEEVHNARFRSLLQGILADRFHLVMRRENKEIPVYAVVVGKNGPQLKKSQVAEKDCAGPDNPQGVPCHGFNGGRGRGLHSKAATIQDVVEAVENWSDRPVLNKTGVEGLYEIDTEGWLPMGASGVAAPPPPGTTPSPEQLALSDPTTPTLFNIFERLGLRMELQKAAVETYVIDRIGRPTEN